MPSLRWGVINRRASPHEDLASGRFVEGGLSGFGYGLDDPFAWICGKGGRALSSGSGNEGMARHSMVFV